MWQIIDLVLMLVDISGALKSGKDEYKASNDGTMVHYSHDRYIKSSKVAPKDGSLENKWIWLYLDDVDVSKNNLSKCKKENKIDSTRLVKLNVSVSGGNPNWCQGLSLDVMYIYAPGFHEFVAVKSTYCSCDYNFSNGCNIDSVVCGEIKTFPRSVAESA